MSCTLTTLAACLTLSGVHLDTGLAVMASPPSPGPGRAWDCDITRPRNPYGIVAVGYELELSRVRWDLELRHQSSIATRADRGENTVQLSLSWRPWGAP